MAYSPDEYTGNGSTTLYTITFPYLDVEDVKVTLDGAATTAFTIVGGGTQVQFNTAPGSGVAIKIYRETPVDSPEATFYTGASVRAVDLNDNFLQNLYYAEETRQVANDATLGTIPDGSVGTAKLANSAVTTPKLANDSVTADKLADNSVDTNAIQSGAVVNSKLGASSVNTVNLIDGAVTNAKLGDSAVNTAELANGAVTDAKIGDNVLTPYVSSVNNGPLAGFRNAIINGNFDVWQRGTSFTGIANGTYCADRWLVQYDGSGGSRAISQLTFSPGQTDVPFEPIYYLRLNQSVAGSGATFNYLAQRIEDVRTFAGQTVTLSFYAQASSAITLPQLNVNQFFGGGAGSSPVTTTITSNVSVGTSWAKYSYTFAVPSISGKTIGTDPTYLALRFNLPINSTFIFYLAQVQFELGPVATPFERRPIGTELALCQWYYIRNTHGPSSSQFSGDVTSGQQYQAVTHFPVVMRTTPTVTLTNAGAAAFPTTTGSVNSSSYGFQEQRTANVTGRGTFISSFTADAEI